MKTYLRIVNWSRYQHYKDRNPPWIKFYIELLDDDDLRAFPISTRLLWDQLLLLAGRFNNAIEYDVNAIASFTRMPREAVREGLVKLLAKGMLKETRTRRKASTEPGSRASKAASNGASKPASTRARPRAREREKQQNLPALESSSRVERSTPPNTRARAPKPESRNGDHPAAADLTEAPREQRIRAVVRELRGADPGSFKTIEPKARSVTAAAFEEAYEKLRARRNVRNQAGLLSHLLEVAGLEARLASDSDQPAELSRIDQLRRNNPDEYITALAGVMTDRDLHDYLATYVPDELEQTRLIDLYHDSRP